MSHKGISDAVGNPSNTSTLELILEYYRLILLYNNNNIIITILALTPSSGEMERNPTLRFRRSRQRRVREIIKSLMVPQISQAYMF